MAGPAQRWVLGALRQGVAPQPGSLRDGCSLGKPSYWLMSAWGSTSLPQSWASPQGG